MAKERAFLFPKFVAIRREVTSRMLDRRGIWKNEVVDDRGGLVRFNELLEADSGGILYFAHPKKSDPFRIDKILMKMCRALADREIIIPVAQHQHMAILDVFGRIEGVNTRHAVVTEHTIENGMNYLHPAQKISLAKDVFVSGVRSGIKFWDKERKKEFKNARWKFAKRNSELHEGWGLKGYRDATIQGVRNKKNVAVVSAQAGRSEVLGAPSPMNAIGLLLNKLNEPQDDNIAIAFVGVDPNPYNLPPEKDHLFSKDVSRISFNETLTRGELRERAKLKGISEAQLVFDMIGEVSREEYVNGPVAA